MFQHIAICWVQALAILRRILILLVPLAWSLSVAASVDPFAKLRVPREEGAGEQFLAGFYIYPHELTETATRLGKDKAAYLDGWVGMLSSKGFNLFYVAAGESFDNWLLLSEKYHFKLIAQLDFAYLTTPTLQEVALKVPAAIRFITTYKDHPNVLAFSVKEEPSLVEMAFVNEYFTRIRAVVPDAPLQLLHARRSTLEYELQNVPLISATDRYAFWGWDSSLGGFAATPASALNWYRNDLNRYSTTARSEATHFQAVFTTAVIVNVVSDDAARTGSIGDYARISRLASAGNQGWSRLDANRLRYVKYYRPPPNCTRAMIWASVFDGARSILHWSGNPTDPLQQSIMSRELYRPSMAASTTFSPEISAALSRNSFSMQIFGPDNRGSYMLDEYSDTVKELQRYGWILNRTTPSKDQSIVNVEGTKVFVRSFDVPAFRGKVLLVINTDVGSWQGNSVESLVGRDDSFGIDALGNLEGYTPYTALRDVKISTAAMAEVFRLSDGVMLSRGGHVSVPPGGGVLLFLGSESELASIRQLSGLSLSKPRAPNGLTALDDHA